MSELERLSQAWLDLKQAESEVVNRRKEIEEQIANLIPGPDEGSKSANLGNVKISVTRKLTRKIDEERYIQHRAFFTEHTSPVKVDYKIDLKKLREIEKYEPGLYQIATRFITAKPAKPSVKVELVEQENQKTNENGGF